MACANRTSCDGREHELADQSECLFYPLSTNNCVALISPPGQTQSAQDAIGLDCNVLVRYFGPDVPLAHVAPCLTHLIADAPSCTGLRFLSRPLIDRSIRSPVQQSPGLLVCTLNRDFPNEFGIFLNYCCALHVNDKPDYSYLRKLFHDLLVREGYQYDYVFDWSVQRLSNPDDKLSCRKVIGDEEGAELKPS